MGIEDENGWMCLCVRVRVYVCVGLNPSFVLLVLKISTGILIVHLVGVYL